MRPSSDGSRERVVAAIDVWGVLAASSGPKELGGFACTLTTLSRTLRGFGLTFKEKTLHPSERG